MIQDLRGDASVETTGIDTHNAQRNRIALPLDDQNL